VPVAVADLLGFPGVVGLRPVGEADALTDAEACGTLAKVPGEEPAALDDVPAGTVSVDGDGLPGPGAGLYADAGADGADIPDAPKGISVSGETGPPSRLQITSSE